MSDIIQGNWDDLVKNHNLHGRCVRVVILDDDQDKAPEDNAWLKSLRAWADSHQPLNHPVDDRRESIYSGTIDDPR